MHVQSHSDSRDFSCGECNKIFKSQRSLDKHMLVHVASQRTADGKKVKLLKKYCRYCAKAFHYVKQMDGSLSAADQLHFEAHEASHTATRNYDVHTSQPMLDLSVPSTVVESANGVMPALSSQASAVLLELC